jgi:hypothetical protein
METNISKLLVNGFIINRESTKHQKTFKYNTFIKPLTPTTFFGLLNTSGINLSSYELLIIFTFKFATDYHTNFKSDIYLHVTETSCYILIDNNKRIMLDYDKTMKKICYLTDDMFKTDFGELKKYTHYYNN